MYMYFRITMYMYYYYYLKRDDKVVTFYDVMG